MRSDGAGIDHRTLILDTILRDDLTVKLQSHRQDLAADLAGDHVGAAVAESFLVMLPRDGEILVVARVPDVINHADVGRRREGICVQVIGGIAVLRAALLRDRIDLVLIPVAKRGPRDLDRGKGVAEGLGLISADDIADRELQSARLARRIHDALRRGVDLPLDPRDRPLVRLSFIRDEALRQDAARLCRGQASDQEYVKGEARRRIVGHAGEIVKGAVSRAVVIVYAGETVEGDGAHDARFKGNGDLEHFLAAVGVKDLDAHDLGLILGGRVCVKDIFLARSFVHAHLTLDRGVGQIPFDVLHLNIQAVLVFHAQDVGIDGGVKGIIAVVGDKVHLIFGRHGDRPFDV